MPILYKLDIFYKTKIFDSFNDTIIINRYSLIFDQLLGFKCSLFMKLNLFFELLILLFQFFETRCHIKK